MLRAVPGIGVAGGLIAAVKEVSDWVGKERTPYYNGLVLAMGGDDALIAMLP